MLTRLYIKNIALISEADIEFCSGLNVLSGETGSGKSVILDSINFVLGSKADKSMIRYGEEEAFVRCEFSVDRNCEAVSKLKDYDIETDGEIIITRKLCLDGKNAIKINGNTVTSLMLKNVTQHLVDVHGQSEHFFLLNETNQLKVVDSFCGAGADNLKVGLSDLINEKKTYKDKLKTLGGDESERARKLDLLAFQINEIESAQLSVGEYDNLKTKQNILINTEKIMSALNFAKAVLSDDGGSIDGINSAHHAINQISHIDEEFNSLCARLDGVNDELSDISMAISDYCDNMNFDTQEAELVEERLSVIKSLRKKYGADEEQIFSYLGKIKEEYDALSNSQVLIEECEKKIEALDDKIFSLCVKLTKLRKAACESFKFNVVEELKSLNIPDAKFNVKFEEYEKATADLSSSNGSDKICFEFSANKGEPFKPLNKVISGGEMSRFMLAVKTQLKDLNGISTYIFDEIDSGISGYTATTVANKFVSISKYTQILAVSHLPQVCAASDNQYYIYKENIGNKTLTKVKRLSREEKIDEIVRLTGGNVSSENSVKHAKELIAQFNK